MKEERKPSIETREQSLAKIKFFCDMLTDRDLKIAAAFMSGLTRENCKRRKGAINE